MTKVMSILQITNYNMFFTSFYMSKFLWIFQVDLKHSLEIFVTKCSYYISSHATFKLFTFTYFGYFITCKNLFCISCNQNSLISLNKDTRKNNKFLCINLVIFEHLSTSSNVSPFFDPFEIIRFVEIPWVGFCSIDDFFVAAKFLLA